MGRVTAWHVWALGLIPTKKQKNKNRTGSTTRPDARSHFSELNSVNSFSFEGWGVLGSNLDTRGSCVLAGVTHKATRQPSSAVLINT